MRRAASAACARTSKQRETGSRNNTKKRGKNGQVASIGTTMKHLVFFFFFFYGGRGCGLACQQRSWSSLGYSFSMNNSGSVWLHVWQRVKDIYVFAVLLLLLFFFFGSSSSFPTPVGRRTYLLFFFLPFFFFVMWMCVMLSFFHISGGLCVCFFYFFFVVVLLCVCVCVFVSVLVECGCCRGV